MIKVKIGVNFHGLNMFYKTNSIRLRVSYLFFKPIVKFNMRSADFNFSFGGRVAKVINEIGVPKKKIINIPNAIEDELVKSINEVKTNKKLNIVYIRRDDPIKGIIEINKAISHFNDKDFIFHFIGPIKNKILGINIKYHGLISDRLQLIKILDKCDILLLPSYSEGMPYVVLEAMARGLIIVASDVGAVNLMVDSKNGILMKKQSRKYIISALKKLSLTTELKLNEMKFNSIKKINNNFIWSLVLKKLVREIKLKIN